MSPPTHSLLARQLKKFFGSEAAAPAELAPFLAAVAESYTSFDDDARILHRTMELSSQELTQANAESRAVIEAFPDVILRLDRDGGIEPLKAPEHAADPQAHRFNKRRISSRIDDLPNPTVRAAFRRGLDELLADGQPKSFSYSLPGEDAEKFFEVRLVALKGSGAIAIIQDVTARKAAELEHERVNRELIAASRQAGMAEIATGVLHNVGNVLNSVNVSVDMVVDAIQKSKVTSLARAMQLVEARRSDLGVFLTDDPKGRHLPEFLSAVTAQLGNERVAMLAEMKALRENIDHIKRIVAVQQSYAKVAGTHEPLAVADLLEDALRMVSSTLAARRVAIVRDYAAVPPVIADRHVVLQILVNLLNNAAHALETRPADRRITLHLAADGPEDVRVEVADNGVGIAAENLAKIFNHGFTTKKSGHGFGLHSGANAAKHMGGSLTALSAGPGEGATFVLTLPLRPRGTARQRTAA